MTADRQPRQSGPPLPLLISISVGLFLIGLITATVMAGTTFPSPYAADIPLLDYFRGHSDAVRVSGLFMFGSAIPLTLFAATASVRLRELGIRAPGATITLAGGIGAGIMAALSGLVNWVLAQVGPTADLPVLKALQGLAFATGGPGMVVFLGLLVAGLAVTGWLGRLVPPALGWIGIGIAGLAELATLTLVAPGLDFLLPVGRFGSLIWLIVTAFVLPIRRRSPNRQLTSTPA